MGSNGARYAVLAAAVAAVVALFVVLSGGDDDGPAGTRAATTETAKKPSGGAPDPPKDHEQKKQKPRAKVPTIEIKGGQPVGGVQRLEFRKGEDIVFRVGSDTADHVHFHGYDIFMDVAAGGEVRFDVPASLEGVFEVELEDTATQIAEITVSPG